MVMSVLLHDAVSMLQDGARAAYRRGDLADVIYADDTLLIGVSSQHLGEYLHAVAAAGAQYGMELHWAKFQRLPVQSDPKVHKPHGDVIPMKLGMDYLGTLLTMFTTDRSLFDASRWQSLISWLSKMYGDAQR